MNRRRVLASCALLLTAPLSKAQRVHRIGFLGAASATGFASQIAGLRAGLKELGYVEGKNIEIEFRWAEGRLERLPALAADLVRRGVDVIVTQGTPATRAAKEATTQIPIVTAAVGDAIVTGLVASLAKPGGNVTGSTFFSSELVAKRIEILKSAMPHLRRVGVTFNPDNPIQLGHLANALTAAGTRLKVDIDRVAFRSVAELEEAIESIAERRADATVFHEEPMHLVNAQKLVALAAKHRLATAGPLEFIPASAVFAYGVHFPELYRRAAFFVDKILKGTRPADIPVEQASRFEFVINLKAARAIGLSIPPHLVPRADKVIE
jgi:putative ABC transport system substrate-binding protein